MTDRIMELRGLHDRTTKAWWKRGRSSHELTTQNDYHVAEFRHGNDALFCNEAHKSMDALLDCAEALAEIVGCPQGVDEATIPAGGVDVRPEQVVVNISVSLVRLRRAQAALARLNGESDEG